MFVAVAASEIVLVHDDLYACKLAVLKRFFDCIDLSMYMPGKRYRRDGMSKWHDTWSDHTSETVRIEHWQDGARLDVLYCNLHSSIKELVTTSSISDKGLELAVDEWRGEIANGKIPGEFSTAFAHICKVSTFTGFADRWIRLHGAVLN
jgi:hypothetical protein